MSTADGFVAGTVKIVDHGPNGARYNIVIVGDGYGAADAGKYHTDVQDFVDTLRGTAPFADLWCGINIHRVDVVSTDGGADDPASCGDLSAGSGAANAALFAVALLALEDAALAAKLRAFRKEQADKVIATKLPD